MITREELIDKYKTKEGGFNLIEVLLDMGKAIEERDLIIGKQEARIRDLESGMTFFANDWETRFGKSIIIPTNDEVNLFKK